MEADSRRSMGGLLVVTRQMCRVIAIALLLVLVVSAEDDPNGQYLTIVSDEATAQPREIALPFEVGILRMQFILSFTGQARMTVINPLGRPLDLAEPNVAVTDEAGKRSIILWDPRPGEWKVRIEGNGAYTFRAVAQGDLYVCCAQIFTRSGINTLDRAKLFAGVAHPIQVFASGYSIDTLNVEMIDERGRTIGPVRFRQTDGSNLSGYMLLLETPSQPFRLMISGRDLNGRDYRRILYQLLRPEPVGEATEAAAEEARNTQQAVDLRGTATTGERRVLRARVAKWVDEPWISEKGNQVGVRLRYTINFPVTGVYSPIPQIYPDRVSYGYTGALGMRVHRASVSPQPAGVTPSGVWNYGSRATFTAGIDYDFVVEMLPNYVVYNEATASFCLQIRPYTQTGLRERFEREVQATQRIRFRFAISGTDLEGRNPALTENSYAPRDLNDGYRREGAGECR